MINPDASSTPRTINLGEQQQRLQSEAYKMIERLKLTQLLSAYGEPRLVGSTALGLMTWRDVDFSIVGPDDEDKFWQIARDLMHQPGMIDIGIQDTRANTYPQYTTGLCINARALLEDMPEPWDRVNSKDICWKIDLWFVTEEHDLASRKTAELKGKLNPEKTLAILTIKNIMAKTPQYRQTIKSMDIYNAVLDHGVRTLEDFDKYMKSK